MRHQPAVHITHGTAHLSDNARGRTLGDARRFAILQVVLQVAALAELHDEIEVFIALDDIE